MSNVCPLVDPDLYAEWCGWLIVVGTLLVVVVQAWREHHR